MKDAMVNQRETTIVELLREIEAEMTRLQSLLDDSQAHLEDFHQGRHSCRNPQRPAQ